MVTLNPALASKINWTQIIAAGASLLAVFGIDLPPETQVQIVTGVALVGQVLTVIIRTFFTGK